MRSINISKGLDIPISGEITDLAITNYLTKKVAVLGKDYHDLKPTMLVKIGDQVKKGQKLLEDKKIPGLFLVAPVSGEVIESNQTIVDDPSKVNSDPESTAWFFKLKIKDSSEIDSLMNREEYEKFSKESNS